MVLGCARFSRARAPLLILPLELQYMYFIEIERKVYSHQISSIINLAIRVSGSLRCHSGVIQVLYKNPAWVPCMFLSVLRTMQHTLLFFLFITTVTHGCRNRWKFQLKDSYLLHEYLQIFVIIVYVIPKKGIPGVKTASHSKNPSRRNQRHRRNIVWAGLNLWKCKIKSVSLRSYFGIPN